MRCELAWRTWWCILVGSGLALALGVHARACDPDPCVPEVLAEARLDGTTWSYTSVDPLRGQTVYLAATVTEDCDDSLEYFWSWDGDDSDAESTSASPTVWWGVAGTYVCNLKVRNPGGPWSNWDSDSVIVKQASAMTVTHTPSTPSNGDSVTASCSITVDGTVYTAANWPSKWGTPNFLWRRVDPYSDHYTVYWDSETSWDGNSWSSTTTFTEGTTWYRVKAVFNANYGRWSSSQASSHRVSVRGDDTNSNVAKAASYILVPYEWGGPDYNGIDCSGLVVAVYSITPDMTADTLHDNYLVAGTDNDTNEDKVPDHTEPWMYAINQAGAGDAWYLHNDDDGQVDHVGIYSGSDMIHASWDSIEVVRTPDDPCDNSTWNGGSSSTIFRGLGRPWE